MNLIASPPVWMTGSELGIWKHGYVEQVQLGAFSEEGRPCSFHVVGTLPTGMALRNGVLSGAPNLGEHRIVVQARSENSMPSNRTFIVVVEEKKVVSPPIEPVVVAEPYRRPEQVVVSSEEPVPAVAPPPAAVPVAPPAPMASPAVEPVVQAVVEDELWVTPAGLIGTYESGSRIDITFATNGAKLFTVVKGRLPQGSILTKSRGRLSGTLRQRAEDTEFWFTLRAELGKRSSEREFVIIVHAKTK